LRELDPSKFDERTYAALAWIRTVLTNPDGAPPEIEERFLKTFTPRERGHVIAAVKGIYFFNLAGNTLDTWLRKLLRRPGYRSGDACRLELHRR